MAPTRLTYTAVLPTQTRDYIVSHPTVVRVDVYGSVGSVSHDVIVALWDALTR